MGLQRNKRQELRMKPRQAPNVVMASIMYLEHEGWKRQLGGILSVSWAR